MPGTPENALDEAWREAARYEPPRPLAPLESWSFGHGSIEEAVKAIEASRRPMAPRGELQDGLRDYYNAPRPDVRVRDKNDPTLRRDRYYGPAK